MVSDSEIRERVEDLLAKYAEPAGDVAAFRGHQFDAGLAFVHFPAGHGGMDGARGQQAIVSGPIAEFIATWTRHRDNLDPVQCAVHRDDVVRLGLEAEVARLTNMRAASRARAGEAGPEGSIGKLAMAELGQRICEKTVNITGAEGMVHPSGYPMQRAGPRRQRDGSFAPAANSIEGGTSEIMRNILGERVLGLPGEPRVDKDIPWKTSPDESRRVPQSFRSI
jgi:hypothetical protein